MSFVDDTRHYNKMNTIMTSLAENIAHDSNIWNTCYQNINKCATYIIEWYYNKKYHLKMINDTDTYIPITSSIHIIHRQNNDTPFKYLGITTAPNGDQTHPVNTLIKYVPPSKTHRSKHQLMKETPKPT